MLEDTSKYKNMQSKHFCKFNFNKYGMHIPDCAVRSVVAATGLDYDIACKMYGCSFKRGHGLIRNSGIALEDIKQKFNSYFDIVVDFNDDFDQA